jgi:hypothetical protein
MQPMPESLKQLQPLTKHAYVEVTPTVNFKVNGVDVKDASVIRKMYLKGNDNDRDQVIADLYGQPDPAIRAVFDKKLGISEQAQNYIREARQFGNVKVVEWLENVLQLEKQVNSTDADFTHINPDYIDEKTYNR